jgi:glucose-1-phosphate adenylyltransferase
VPRTLVLILAGGAGGRLELLTERRAKPAVPFAGTHRLIDFPLSNCLNAGLSDVWVSQQFQPVSLSDHLANGRPWDLDRTTGGLLLLQPRQGDERAGFQGGTAQALWSNAELIRQFDPDALVVLSADAVYKLDYGALVREHLEAGDAVTMVTYEVDEPARYGVVQVEDGRVRDYVYKPDEPDGNLISNEVFAFEPHRVLDLLDEIAQETELEDLGHQLLPALVQAGEAREHRFEGFWRDVGTIPAYWSCHQELLDGALDLDDPAWPILTRAIAHRASAYVTGGAVERSLIGPGARVAGEVRGSVNGRGAVVEAGAAVVDSVVLPGARVRSGARVERAILDDGVDVRADVGRAGGEIALVGLEAVVDTPLEAGARFPTLEDG